MSNAPASDAGAFAYITSRVLPKTARGYVNKTAVNRIFRFTAVLMLLNCLAGR